MLGAAQTGPIKSLSLTVSVLDRIQLGVESLVVLEYTVSWGVPVPRVARVSNRVGMEPRAGLVPLSIVRPA